MQRLFLQLKIPETSEPLTSNQQVGGSSPPGIAILYNKLQISVCPFKSLERRLDYRTISLKNAAKKSHPSNWDNQKGRRPLNKGKKAIAFWSKAVTVIPNLGIVLSFWSLTHLLNLLIRLCRKRF